MPLEDSIAQLVRLFQNDPRSFFHEREVHAVFFSLCRELGGTAETADGVHVHRCRHEYDSFWRYRRSGLGGYDHRYSDEGTTACFDFAFLDEGFVQEHSLLAVINKDESKRVAIRQQMQQHGAQNPIEAAVEFKMAHLRSHNVVTEGAINSLDNGMSLDSGKIAIEGIPVGYVLGFSHGPLPDHRRAAQIVQRCLDEHRNPSRRNNGQAGELRVAMITPEMTILGGNWNNPDAFPNLAQPVV